MSNPKALNMQKLFTEIITKSLETHFKVKGCVLKISTEQFSFMVQIYFVSQQTVTP